MISDKLAKVKGKMACWDGFEHSGMTALRILDEIAWDFTQVKMMVLADRDVWRGSLELLTRNSHGPEPGLKEEVYLFYCLSPT